MDTHNICLYIEVDKNYTDCNLKTTELLDCALIGVCAVIRSNTVCCGYSFELPQQVKTLQIITNNIRFYKANQKMKSDKPH